MRRTLVVLCALALCGGPSAWAAGKNVDLDGQSGNGAESRCDLNVITTFPVKIENVVTNKAVDDAFDFAWTSAGPGGFTSSAAAGTPGGVGAKWTWTTNQSVFSFTGATCEKDICFLQTAGPDPVSSTCSLGCIDDGVSLTVDKGAGGEAILNWSGGTPDYTVYRSDDASLVPVEGNEQTTTSGQTYTDVTSGSFFYVVRASTCNEFRSCNANSDCLPAEGTCVSRGPFQCPGRSLTPTDITVSSASLTSSLITFFSPPTEVFRVTSVANPGGVQDTQTNASSTPQTVITEEQPPGCCPDDPLVPEQLRCGDDCVDYLNDPQNCGACGNVCAGDQCCSNGNCVDLCPAGQVLCNGECVDLLNDPENCGACGDSCGPDACCDGAGGCQDFCLPGLAWCGEEIGCSDLQNDSGHCGACGAACAEDECCNGATCLPICDPGLTQCPDELCYDLQMDNDNCGVCGNLCPPGEQCSGGACAPCPGGICDTDIDAILPNCDLENKGPVPGGCDNPNPTSGIPPVCPDPGPPAPPVNVAPTCVVEASEETLAPGESLTTCRPAGLLFKEVATEITVCGDSIPGPNETCGGGVTNKASGTFMRFVPDNDTVVGAAFPTPFGAQVTSEDSGDYMIAPGETATLVIDVLNAGPSDIVGASATVIADPVDLTDDGTANPVALTVDVGTSSYGTIAGTQPSVDCAPLTLQPASNQTEFQITVPADHPIDTAHPFKLRIDGTVDSAPFTFDMPIAIGIVDVCDVQEDSRDFDGVDGLLNPMADLVPEGNPVPFPTKSFNTGKTLPLKMRVLCGGVELQGADVDAPEIVGLSEETLGPLDILTLNLNDDPDADDLFFRFNDTTKQWIFNMRTPDLGAGKYTLEIRVAGRKNYFTGFELR